MRPFLAAILFFGLPLVANAATFSSDPVTSHVGIGQVAKFIVYLDSEGKAINALDAAISYDEKRLTLRGVIDGDSIISVWLKKLDSKKTGGQTFAGIIPRGYEGKRGKLFTLYFVAKQSGDVTVGISGDAYLNDGSGTKIPLRALKSHVSVVEGQVAGAATEIPDDDFEGPHSIKAVVAQNEAMFGGKPFIIVDAKDSTSGIEKYQLLESDTAYDLSMLRTDSTLLWKTIENPEALDAPLAKYLYVRAIDRNGNATVILVAPPEDVSPANKPGLFGAVVSFGLLIAGLVILYVLYRLLRPSHA